jgi:hypothetical protein
VDIVVTVADTTGSTVTISDSATDVGGTSLTFAGVTGTGYNWVYVHGYNVGSTTLLAQAAGYNDGNSNVTVDPSGFYIYQPGSINTTVSAANTNIIIAAGRLDPTTLNVSTYQSVRAGLSASVPVISSDTLIGTITTSPLVFSAGVNSMTTQFDPEAEGTSTISVGTPAGFDTPSNRQEITATVNP